ncbi:hypothetical protein BJ170DRAFT_592042 [Xylariales sp. AK1849]|nr:hypothetical protein BJ170DRAFT_592042 [Xylariales sp. AK1849]
MASEDENDEDFDVPLQHKRPFGSGVRRRHIAFVPASSGNLNSTGQDIPGAPSRSVADLYLDIVMPKDLGSTQPVVAPPQLCEVCQLPLDESTGGTAGDASKPGRHEASIAHQVCLTHSHPPSALDRSRMGLSVLQSQGWDPDGRSGLGVVQQGMQYPIKVKEKNDTLGIGVKIPRDFQPAKKEKAQRLDAKKVRKMAAEDKKRKERLQRQFYGNGDLEKYLGLG